ncbi:MAG: insulinase family protein [Myxococcales bacterium]|nr:insulinase family protein [Myxococcales bacterium]
MLAALMAALLASATPQPHATCEAIPTLGPATAPIVVRWFLDPVVTRELSLWFEIRRLIGDLHGEVAFAPVLVASATHRAPAEERVRAWYAAAACNGRAEAALRLLAREGTARISRRLAETEGRRALADLAGVAADRLDDPQLDALIERGMTPEEFELTRAFLRKYALHFADTTSSRLGYAIDDRFYGLDASHLERFRAVMDELTLEEVNAAIRTHLQSQNLKIAIVTGDPEGLAKQLTSGQPTPITYDAPKPASVMAEDESIARYPLSIQPGDIRTVQVDEMFQR